MTTDPSNVITLVHHDSEERMYVTGYQNPGSYIHEIQYAASIPQLLAMKVHSWNKLHPFKIKTLREKFNSCTST